jgi:uncharacterized protein
MIGTLVNTAAVIVGGSLGMFIKHRLPEKYVRIYFQAVGLFTIVLGSSMSLKMAFPLMVVASLACGGILGEWLQLEEKTNRLGETLKKKLRFSNERFTEGLVTAFLLFCMGSMSIIGAIEEGFGKTSDLLLTKSLMDGFSALMLASALGIGVVFSSIPLLLFQGGITLMVWMFAKDIPTIYINEITAVGGILLIGLGISILEIRKLNIINLLPSLVFICLFLYIRSYFAI